MSNNNASVNIHQAARNLMAMPRLPSLKVNGVPHLGLCFVLQEYGGCVEAHEAIANYGCTYIQGNYLPERGHWTEQRLNILCLLAITEPEDWV